MFGRLVPMHETNETLRAQQREMLGGRRMAQLFPGGKGELPLPHGVHRTVTANGDVFHFMPHQISAHAIHHASRAGTENHVLGLGPFSKHEVMSRIAQGETPVSVVERSSDGVELRAASGTHKTAMAQMQAMSFSKAPDSSISIEHPMHTIARRAIGILNR